MKKVVISIVVVVAIALVVCLVPLKEVAYSVTVDYQDTAPLSYEVIEAKSYVGYEQGAWHEGYTNPLIGIWMPGYYETVLVSGYGVTLRNTDEVGGTFTVQLRFEESPELRAQSIYLKPGEEGLVGFRDTRGRFTYEVIPETKTVTKQHPETHYKKITLLDYWLHY
jgi:hypothetical protein